MELLLKLSECRYRLGVDCIIDPSVVLGYKALRDLKVKGCVIGMGARIRMNTVIYSNTVFGDYLETGYNVIIREENQIGDQFKIWNNSCVDYGCTVGNDLRIHNNV